MTQIWEIARKTRSLTTEQMSVPYYMYFDETQNWKSIKKEGKPKILRTLNIPNIQEHFVFGGIATKDYEEPITLDELLNIFRMSPAKKEVKATDVIKNDFLSSLKSKQLHCLLQYIRNRKWFLHFSVTNLLYYSIDEIMMGLVMNSKYGKLVFSDESYLIRDEFYRIFANDLEWNVKQLISFDYPAVKNENLSAFRTFVTGMVVKYIGRTNAMNNITKIILEVLKDSEDKKRDVVFVEDEKNGILIHDFLQFFTTRICMLAYSHLTLDEEADVETHLKQKSICVHGRKLDNFQFMNSKSNTYIQISDLIVSLISRYFNFLDRRWEDVQKDLDGLKYLDKKNLYLLNNLLIYSEHESTLLFDMVERYEVVCNFRKSLLMYK